MSPRPRSPRCAPRFAPQSICPTTIGKQLASVYILSFWVLLLKGGNRSGIHVTLTLTPWATGNTRSANNLNPPQPPLTRPLIHPHTHIHTRGMYDSKCHPPHPFNQPPYLLAHRPTNSNKDPVFLLTNFLYEQPNGGSRVGR